MQTSGKLQANQRGGKPKTHGKRKHLDQGSPALEGSNTQQTTIADLFTKSKETVSTADQLSPSNKRLKRDNLKPNHRNLSTGPEIIPPEKMYNFSSSSPKGNAVIDLTNSPSGKLANGSVKNNFINGSFRPASFSPHTGAKKLVVKNLRTTPKIDPEQYFSKTWGQLDASLSAIFNSEKPIYSMEELYKGTENICRQGKAPELYRNVRQRFKDHTTQTLKANLRSKAEAGTNVEMVASIVDAWALWNRQLTTIRSILFYMDQSYLLRSSENPSINELGLNHFRTNVFGDTTLKPRLMQGVLELLSQDRNASGGSPDSSLLRSAVGLFHDLGTYTSDFEAYFIDNSHAFFSSWVSDQVSSADLATYVDQSHRLIEREMVRCDVYHLDRSTRRELSQLIDEILVEKQLGFLLDKDDVVELLKNDNQKALGQLYALLQRIGRATELRAPFDVYIVDEGSSIVFDEEREQEMVARLLEFKARLDHTLNFSFHKDEVLGHTLRESFEVFINKTKKTQANWNTDNPKPGEMIAKHIDLLLKGGIKAMSSSIVASSKSSLRKPEEDDDEGTMADEDAEINKQLDQALDLFRFVHGKAVFEAFYKKDLARRLLMGRSASADAERSMLSRLKTECGAGFTHNLESMFKDMDLARDEIASYNNLFADRNTKTGPDLNVSVLSASAWPTYPDVPVNIPISISKLLHDFEQHYTSKYNGRKLTWKHALAHCQLRAKFPKGNKEIVVSSFQAIVLLLFNDVPEGGTLSYDDIQAATGLSELELKRTLQSLACAKYRVLTKFPRGRDVDNSDKFAYNPNFHDPKFRIKINQIQLKETKEENKETHQRVAADRHYETQAAIVRIMKSRKTIKHAELVAEVIKATKSRGVLDPADIKKNIEKLIEKDYMEREEGQKNTYVYLA